MSATITLRLNDQASKGLGEVQHSAEETKAEFEQLSEAQKQHIEVIHKHQGSMLEFAGNSVKAIGSVGSAWIAFRTQALWLESYQQLLSGASRATQALASNTGNLARVGAQGLTFVPRFGTAIGRFLPIVTGFTLGLGAANRLLASTGHELKQSAEATDDQRRRFAALREEATYLNVQLAELAKRRNVNLDELGVSSESNLDRFRSARSQTLESMGRPLKDLAKGAAEVAHNLNPLVPLWREIDSAATRGTNNAISNLKLLEDAADSAADAFFGPGYTERAKAQEKFNETLEETRRNFERIRDVHETLEASRRRADEARRVAALNTLQAIDAEIQKEKERVGLLAAARKFDETAQQEHLQRMTALDQQRTRVVEAEERKRLAIRQASLDFYRKMDERSLREQAQRRDDYLRESREAYERHQAIMAQREQAIRDFRFALHREVVNDAIAALEREGADAETIHAAKLQQIEQERNQRLAATDDQMEKERILFEAEQRLLQEESALRREQLRKQVDDERRAAEEKLRIRKELHDRLRGQLEGQGVTGESILQQQDQRKVLEMLQARRRAAAEQAFRQSEEGQRMSAEANTGSQANARFKARLRAVNRQADIDAFRDARAGNLNPGELQQAQSDAARQQLQAMQRNGKLSSDVVQVLTQQAQAAAQQQATIDILQQQVEALNTQARCQQRAAAGTRQRAQRGSLGE